MVMRLARTVAEPTAKNGFLFTILGSKWGFLWLWLLIINVLALLAYGLDKLLAKLKDNLAVIDEDRVASVAIARQALEGGGGDMLVALDIVGGDDELVLSGPPTLRLQ